MVRKALGLSARARRAIPATRTFQAIRIHLNAELDELEQGLRAAERALAPGGRLAVVTFHSLEDRIVKRFLKSRSGATPAGSRHRPEAVSGPAPSFGHVKKPVAASERELAINPRARSARLRSAVRTDAPAWDQAKFPREAEHESAQFPVGRYGSRRSPARRSAAIWFRCASRRNAPQLEDVETEIVLAQRDIRLLQTEIGTRGRLAQLERWNVKVLALSAPSADQFVEGGFALAALAQPERKVDLDAPVVLASAPVVDQPAAKIIEARLSSRRGARSRACRPAR